MENTMNNLMIFNNEEFGNIRGKKINGEPWFVGKDICTAFGDMNHNRSLSRVDTMDKCVAEIIDNMGRKQEAVCVNESGIYSLLFSMQPQKSNKNGVSDAYPIEAAERMEKLRRFKRWVTSEVLPTIRNTGGYVSNEDMFISTYLPFADDNTKALFSTTLETIRQQNKMIEDQQKQIAEHLEQIEEQQEQIVELDEQLEEQQPLVDFANHVSEHSGVMEIGEFAKLLHRENINIGRNKLFDWFRKHGYLMWNNIPYQQYINTGYFEVVERVIQTPYTPIVSTKTLITGKGQIYFTEKFKKQYGKKQ